MDFTLLKNYLDPKIITYFQNMSLEKLSDNLLNIYVQNQAMLEKLEETTFASAIIGQHGESYVQNLLKYDVELVAKRSYSTDLMVNSKYGPILIEVKNYTCDIPTKEIVKFRRDISMNKNAVGGIFISLNTNITSKGFMSFENLWTEDPLLIYLASDDEQIINNCVLIIEQYVDRQMTKSLNRERLYTLIEEIAEHNNQLLYATKLVADTKTMVIKNLDNIQQKINVSEMNIRRLLRETSAILLERNPVEEQFLLNMENNFTEIAVDTLTDPTYVEFLKCVLTYISDTKTLIIKKIKNEIIFMDSIICKVKPLKTKMILSIKIKNPIFIPLSASFKNKWIIFDITKKTMNLSLIYGIIDDIKKGQDYDEYITETKIKNIADKDDQSSKNNSSGEKDLTSEPSIMKNE